MTTSAYRDHKPADRLFSNRNVHESLLGGLRLLPFHRRVASAGVLLIGGSCRRTRKHQRNRRHRTWYVLTMSGFSQFVPYAGQFDFGTCFESHRVFVFAPFLSTRHVRHYFVFGIVYELSSIWQGVHCMNAGMRHVTALTRTIMASLRKRRLHVSRLVMAMITKVNAKCPSTGKSENEEQTVKTWVTL